MFTIDQYVIAESLEEAYELNQSRRNVILGGIMWLKMGKKRIGKAIDLSALDLHKIEEDEDRFYIGAMCTLRDLEVHSGLKKYFNGIIEKSVESIVGVQFRNGATVGGTVFSRFGFSDVLTVLLALDTYVELYKGGIVSLSQFMDMPRDNDILVKIIIKKDNRKVAYVNQRKSASDLPILACAVSNTGNTWNIVLGSRPAKAQLISLELSENLHEEQINEIINVVKDKIVLGSNDRGSKEYRSILADVFIRRNIEEILLGGNHAD